MFTKQNIRKFHFGQGLQKTFLLSNENGKFQFNNFYDNAPNKIKSARLLNGTAYRYICDPMFEADTFDELVDLMNKKFKEFCESKGESYELLPVDYDAYDAIMDRQKSMPKPTVALVNKYFESVGVYAKIEKISKRRNRNYYIAHEAVSYNQINVNLDFDEKISNFAEKYWIGIINRLLRSQSFRCYFTGRILSTITPCRNYNDFFNHLQLNEGPDFFRIYQFQKSLVRYREMFFCLNNYDKLILNNFLSQTSTIRNIGDLHDFGIAVINSENNYTYELKSPAALEILISAEHLASYKQQTADLIEKNKKDAVEWFSGAYSSIPEFV